MEEIWDEYAFQVVPNKRDFGDELSRNFGEGEIIGDVNEASAICGYLVPKDPTKQRYNIVYVDSKKLAHIYGDYNGPHDQNTIESESLREALESVFKALV